MGGASFRGTSYALLLILVVHVWQERKYVSELSPSFSTQAPSQKQPPSHHGTVCGANATVQSEEWKSLCTAGLAQTLDNEIYVQNKDVYIVQIGAHVGFEPNDPLDKGLGFYLYQLPQELRRAKVHWTFVEPSPPNFKRLTENLQQRADLCDLQSVNAGIVADSVDTSHPMTFYSISESIDPETGYDARSGKTLPNYITQISSFGMGVINHNAGQFRKRGLNVNDYVVKTNVTTKRYSDLMQEIITAPQQPPTLVLIDTEGFDCDIILGISSTSSYWPKYLIYEHVNCARGKRQQTEAYLTQLGYTLTGMDTQNTFAYKHGTSVMAAQ